MVEGKSKVDTEGIIELFRELDSRGLVGISPQVLEGLEDEDEILYWTQILVKDRLQHLSLYAQLKGKPPPAPIEVVDLDSLRVVFERLFQEADRILS